MLNKMNGRILKCSLLLVVMLVVSCKEKSHQENPVPTMEVPVIFSQLSPEQSGVSFTNNLNEDSIVNYFTYPYIYMGGGVAIGDVNNDGLQDLYFTGNQVPNKLYLNKGDLTFEDITDQAQVGGDDRWVTGVTMADVNTDGWLDIYVSVSGKFTTTKNLLFINNGVDKDGIPSFTEGAEQAGIADEGHSTQGTFFDYDKDGDLDLYVANYPFTSFKTMNFAYKFMMDKKEEGKSDKLFQNQGDGTFTDVTEEAGLLNFGLSLGVVAGDFNQDSWEDLYISNDFATPDHFYFNNGDGTFTEKVKETTSHTAFFGMGVDAADFNNDGLLDILQMDMTPADNRRNKANMASMDPAAFYEMISLGMHFQYMQNGLQLNNGITEQGNPHFSDIARLTGMSSTDWSWAGLFADLDNDGWKDIFITNGTRKDINNKDYFAPIDKANYQQRKEFDYLELSRNIPSERIDNFAFKNNGDLTFTNSIDQWGLSFEGYSNGAAYGDLDNDGDLDMVINNIDDHSIIFMNQTSDQKLANHLRIKLLGSEKNPQGLGARVTIRAGGEKQYQYHTLTRGFQSSVEPMVHFGLGTEDMVQEITVIWPDGKIELRHNIKANQTLEFRYQDADQSQPKKLSPVRKLFSDASKELRVDYRHEENNFNDFEHEVLLPHIYSRNGPGLASGDVNGDGLDDFFIGGAINSSGVLYVQNERGTFNRSIETAWQSDADKEDMGATFFDADGDGDLDLYVVSGGNEFLEGSPQLQDRLYLNSGQGQFNKSLGALPEMYSSGSRVKPGDYDGDGDLDLFVGGRILPRSYPLPAKSYLLRNEGIRNGEVQFSDVTSEVSPDLMEAGLVTDAVWVDFNQDDQLDLVIVGEWMPLTFLKNSGSVLENKTQEYGLSGTTGWWYSIVAEDFDQDGDIDFAAGNLGLNYKYHANESESFDVYTYDYDKNGKLDIVLGYYDGGIQYPLRGKQCSSQQIPVINVKYQDYNSFAEATLSEVYSQHDLEASLHYQAYNFASSYVENHGDENFSLSNLPNQVQLSSINDIVTGDFNGDGHLDMVVAGNLYGAEVETTRNDAGYGYLLTGDGRGNFRAVPYAESGIYLPFDTKDLTMIKGINSTIILAANNNDSLKVLKMNAQP